jgi:hypothetical protein
MLDAGMTDPDEKVERVELMEANSMPKALFPPGVTLAKQSVPGSHIRVMFCNSPMRGIEVALCVNGTFGIVVMPACHANCERN